MVNIYCITDCNGLNYVGSTIQPLKKRLYRHRTSSNRQTKERVPVSHHLDLHHSTIKLLEECDECNRIEREKYWINKINCINVMRYTYEHENDSSQYHKNRREYVNSWGGDVRGNNNLLKIDVNLFA